MPKDPVNDAIIKVAVKKAQQIAREQGLTIGQTVAHPNDRLTYMLISIKDNTANVRVPADCSPTGQKIERQFPLDELFDPNVAKHEAIKIQSSIVVGQISTTPIGRD